MFVPSVAVGLKHPSTAALLQELPDVVATTVSLVTAIFCICCEGGLDKSASDLSIATLTFLSCYWDNTSLSIQPWSLKNRRT